MGVKLRDDVLTAYHEAGHTVSRYKLELSLPKTVTIEPGADCLGCCRHDTTPPWMTKELIRQMPEMGSIIRNQIELQVISYLSGYAAEMRRRRITRIVAYLMVSEGIKSVPPKLGGSSSSDFFEALEHLGIFEPNEEKRQAWLLSLWDRAWKQVGEWWKDIGSVSAILIERRTVDGEVFSDMFLGKEP